MTQAKLLLQELWLEDTDWYERVKPRSLIKWNVFVENISSIGLIEIPRWVQFSPKKRIQLHGFSDASEKAYCAALYIRSMDMNHQISCHLLVARAKVAPLQTVSLPRLELCCAVLLSHLAKSVKETLVVEFSDIFFWSDSQIVLAWLEKPPHTWKTYVVNRTAQILQNVENAIWRHVISSENPADLGTRGCKSQDLVSNTLWWNGPAWLHHPEEAWPKPTLSSTLPPEQRKVEVLLTLDDHTDILDRSQERRIYSIKGIYAENQGDHMGPTM